MPLTFQVATFTRHYASRIVPRQGPRGQGLGLVAGRQDDVVERVRRAVAVLARLGRLDVGAPGDGAVQVVHVEVVVAGEARRRRAVVAESAPRVLDAEEL